MLALAVLAACGRVGPVPPAASLGPSLPAAAEDSCGAGPRARLVGQPATALERELILAPVRLIRPGQAVTEEFRPTRINFHIDGAERIARITCG
ncbi:Peptidase inhibitor I78 family protein [Wenxinia saemankumensis]|uniref:Peptidase inhibitor I78 family protein n=1 Tax=Wenxinia saemankumensis TaxID=1447782 RepID=A0A1M6DZC6_9RHOB|nr:Peptidase inhibitor I78 family protein [Wenxinia saemankumensis]